MKCGIDEYLHHSQQRVQQGAVADLGGAGGHWGDEAAAAAVVVHELSAGRTTIVIPSGL